MKDKSKLKVNLVRDASLVKFVDEEGNVLRSDFYFDQADVKNAVKDFVEAVIFNIGEVEELTLTGWSANPFVLNVTEYREVNNVVGSKERLEIVTEEEMLEDTTIQ